MIEVSGFTINEARQLCAYAESALKELKLKPHYWCADVHGKTLKIRKLFEDAVQSHEGHGPYQEAYAKVARVLPDGRSVIKKVDQDDLYKKHGEYLDFVTDFDNEIVPDLVVRKFPNEWRSSVDGCESLTMMLNEFDLWEDTESLLDDLYTE